MRDDALALVKLGGAAITDKRSTRALDARGLADGARAIAALTRAGARVVLAHGAGSFGHAEARACGCARGGDLAGDEAFARGVRETRTAVATLNAHVVRALRELGVDAFGVSPSSEGWRTRGVGVEDEGSSDGGARVLEAAKRGRVPVIHGDVCEDSTQGTSVLSGDDIIAWCASWAVRDGSWRDVRVVFCSDVFGVYSTPPSARVVAPDDPLEPLRIASDETAVLYREIVVDDVGADDASPSWRCVRASPLRALDVDAPTSDLPAATFAVDPNVADVTGGLHAKLTRAIEIARTLRGAFPTPDVPRVFLTRAGAFAAATDAPPRDHALDAALGRFHDPTQRIASDVHLDASTTRDFVGTSLRVARRDARAVS